MATTKYLARIRPNTKKGASPRRYSLLGFKKHFREEGGWQEVTAEQAEYLRTIHERAGDESSNFLFEVKTLEEAKAIDARERDARVRSARVSPSEAVGEPQDIAPPLPAAQRGSDLMPDELAAGTSRLKRVPPQARPRTMRPATPDEGGTR